MKKSHPFIITLITIAITATNANANSSFAKPDRNGDYFDNYGPIQAKKPGNDPGSLWQVISPGLNCRSDRGIQSPIVRSFKKGTILQANVGRGGSDEMWLNWKDQQGKPWMRVRSEAGEDYACNVRANSRYIKPYTGK
jgi:hypothetical protein